MKTTPAAPLSAVVAILGAMDPEMARIEDLLKALGVETRYATKDGKRVSPATAYRADPMDFAGDAAGIGEAWLIECQPSWVGTTGPNEGPVTLPARTFDHHRPGDPGFGLSPSNYWRASSLGQVYEALRDLGAPVPPITDDLRLAAAADHCLGAAYRGRCPGVDPAALREWRTRTRAAFQKVDPAELRRRQDAAIDALRDLPRLHLNGIVFADARGRVIPELPEAAAILGQAVVYTLPVKDRPGVKEGVLNGTPEEIRAWLEDAKTRLHTVYGDPARGFAGGYTKLPSA